MLVFSPRAPAWAQGPPGGSWAPASEAPWGPWAQGLCSCICCLLARSSAKLQVENLLLARQAAWRLHNSFDSMQQAGMLMLCMCLAQEPFFLRFKRELLDVTGPEILDVTCPPCNPGRDLSMQAFCSGMRFRKPMLLGARACLCRI